MNTGTTRRTCRKCHRPFTDIDHYGKWLKGCIDCNVWIDPDGSWRNIPKEDIEALKGLKHIKPT